MARESRSRSPTRREPHSQNDYRSLGPQSEKRRNREDDRDIGDSERYRRRRYDDDEDDGYRRDSGRRGPDRNVEREKSYDRRGSGVDEKERDKEYERRRDRHREGERDRDRDRRRDYDREYNRRVGPSSSGRPPLSPPRRSSRPRSRSPRRSQPQSRSRSRSRSKSASVSEKDKDKGKPNFKQSGLLAAETNAIKLSDGTKTVLKYNEPPEARKPVVGWRLYVFKGKEQTDLLHIQRQSAYLIGRDKAIVDIYVEHPSCSKQHAVIQHRQVQQKDEFGSSKPVIKPFIIDLESTNGTLVNDEAIPVSRYYELKMGDVIKFGQSTREYVLLHDDA